MAKKGCTTINLKEKASSKPKKPERIPFLELVTGHSFCVTDVGSMPEGENYWCAFCGGRGKHFIEIKREDKKKYKVGKRCLGKVGLTMDDAPEKVLLAKHPDAVPVEALNGNHAPSPPKEDILDDEIEALLKSL